MLDITKAATLTPDQQVAITDLAHALETEFGAPPLNDAALIGLETDEFEHWIVSDDSRLVGYAQLDRVSTSAEIAAGPDVAAELLTAVVDELPGALVWAHGQRSPVGAAAKSLGYPAIRTLWQLRRPLTNLDPIPAHEVTLRAFRVGSDEAAWLELNSAAFVDHDEQGDWTMADLTAREAEPWFDPAGFLMAERDDQLLGFHWTKVHPGGIGEVYVLAVAPAAQGLHLGQVLLAAGLHHLAEAGLHTVLLYVDDDNPAAMALYLRRGFERYDVDVQYRVG